MTRPHYRAADRVPTWTSRALQYLRDADDLVPLPLMQKALGATNDQLNATIHHLCVRAGAVDVREEDGVRYVMLTGTDRRSKTVDVRVQEPRGNRTRRRRAPAAPMAQ